MTFPKSIARGARITSRSLSKRCCRAWRKKTWRSTQMYSARSASSQMKMTPAEALTAATINAAYSLGRGDETGSLETGKRADFVIHDCADYREVAYFFGVEHANAVYVDGRLVFSREE